MENPRPFELPGDVFVELRMALGYMSAADAVVAMQAGAMFDRRGLEPKFCGLVSWGYAKVTNLEKIRWDSDPSDWRGRFSHYDLGDLVDGVWVFWDDKWYRRFERAMEWQAQVALYGVEVYAGAELDKSLYAPLPAAHVEAVVWAVIDRWTGETSTPVHLPEPALQLLGEKIRDETLYVLRLLELDRSAHGGDVDITRSLLQLGDSARPDTPYMRSLTFVYRLAVELLEAEEERRWGGDGKLG